MFDVNIEPSDGAEGGELERVFKADNIKINKTVKKIDLKDLGIDASSLNQEEIKKILKSKGLDSKTSLQFKVGDKEFASTDIEGITLQNGLAPISLDSPQPISLEKIPFYQRSKILHIGLFIGVTIFPILLVLISMVISKVDVFY